MRVERLGITLTAVTALVDGEPDARARIATSGADSRTVVTVTLDAGPLASIGLRLRARGVRQYLRNGYMSWDGSYFVDPIASQEVAKADPLIRHAHAMTALLPTGGGGALVIGFARHNRFQSRLLFALEDDDLLIDVETLLDSVPGAFASEELVIFAGDEVEESLRDWARLVAAASPLPPRLPVRRFTGWCSWYNLYASLSEPVLLEHLETARRYRDDTRTPFDFFLVDDGFTPEMGDWLEFKPQFPSGIKPVLDAARDAGFTPGVWIAPFMVGNRSKLFAAHPDWVVRSRSTGGPVAPMKFYGEFRWHKRSEEYYVLDVTHPEAEAYIRDVFRVWAKDWGDGYFKTDFMHLGSMYGPEDAVWHDVGLSRMAIWMRMARLIREEIGDAKWLLCGSPICPDCILLRDRFHDLSNDQVHSLATFAGLAGGVLMTSDQLDEVPEERGALLHELADEATPFQCDFPELGKSSLTYTLGTAPNGKPMAVSHGDPALIQPVSAPSRASRSTWDRINR